MAVRKILDWKTYYFNDYAKSYEKFLKTLDEVRINYASYNIDRKRKFWNSYYIFFKKTIKLFCFLFCNNGMIDTTSEIGTVRDILYFDYLKNGNKFFELYCALVEMNRQKFSTILPSSEKYLERKYKKMFIELNTVCKNRVEIEREYAI